MLDDLNVIKQRDPQNSIGYAATQPQHLAYDFGIAKQSLGDKTFANVVVAGMGGSALPGELVRNFPTLNVPFVICKDYDLPDFVGPDSLVICSSFSGNTEETLSALEDAKKRGATIVISANGGKLAQAAKDGGYLFSQVPESPQPRMAVFYAYKGFVEILVAAKVAPASAADEVAKMVEPLSEAVKQWAPEVPTKDNLAKQLAEQLAGKTPIIYSGPKMYPAAYKWKISVNENAKNTCWYNTLPEFSHNEFIGWSSHPVEKPFAVIDLVSSFEHPRTIKRFEVSDRLLSGMRPKSTRVEAKGQSALEHMLYLILLGDFTSIYLAMLNGVNPTPVDLVEKFKVELG